MNRLLRAGILITFGMLMICIISGCDDSTEKITDPPQSKDDIPPSPIITVIVDPPPGSEIDQNLTEFTLQFNQEVIGVVVNDTIATGFGFAWKVVPHLPLGERKYLNIRWTNQNDFTGTIQVGPYSVWLFNGEPPIITSSTVRDGSNDVDPVLINAAGFQFDFNQRVTGTIKLTDEAGVDLHWIGNVQDKSATLTPILGQELAHGTIYKIELDISDGAGNPLSIKTITFVTKIK